MVVNVRGRVYQTDMFGGEDDGINNRIRVGARESAQVNCMGRERKREKRNKLGGASEMFLVKGVVWCGVLG